MILPAVAAAMLLLGGVTNAQIPIDDMSVYAEARKAYMDGDEALVKVIDSFKAQAEEFLAMPDMSVTDKKLLPPSNDPRDYMSLAPYWWPDPDKPDGLPYIRHDGRINPETENYLEVKNAGRMSRSVQILGLLYYFTGEEKYADKCASLLRTWFLDPVKGMNPNMNFGQAIPGRNVGRDAGIIHAHEMLRSFLGAYFIKDSAAWTANDKEGLKEWAWAFWYWLGHSKNGIAECKALNNHGLWYEVSRLYTMSLFATPEEIVAYARDNFIPRMSVQIMEDGSLPAELARTNSLSYSTYAIDAMLAADRICRNAGFSIVEQVTENGRSIAKAIEFVEPYYERPEIWEYQQISPFAPTRAAAVLLEAGELMGRNEWVDTARKIGYSVKTPDIKSIRYFKLLK